MISGDFCWIYSFERFRDSMNFSDIVGQSVLVDRLKRIMQNQLIGHAYLFVGPEGIGKKTVSNIFARGLLCKSQGNRPCDLCRSCKQFNTGNHPDIYRVTRGSRLSIGVEQIRKMLEDTQLKPYESGRKIYIIEDAHTMTVQAQNALLKTLEEPPGFTTIMLLADRSQGLLPTVLSRCQVFRMQKLTKKEVCSILVSNLDLSEEKAMLFASLSDGIPGRGLQLAGSKEFNDMREEVFKFLSEFSRLDDMGKMQYKDLFTKYRDNIDVVMDIMVLWFRDILVYKEVHNNHLIINLDKLALLKGQASIFTVKRVRSIIEKIEQSRRMLKGNANYQMTIENLLLAL